MANPLLIVNKSKLIEEKSQVLFDDLLASYNAGDIKSPTELQYQLSKRLEELYTQLGTPTMKKRLAWGPPISSYYNSMILEIFNDIKTLFSETQNMSAAIIESFEHVEMDRQVLLWEMNRLKDELVQVGLQMAQEEQQETFRDSFMNFDYFDQEMVEGDIAAINAKEGILSLLKVESQDYLTDVKIRIIEGNGFSGNTHQVRAIAGSYKFYGEDNMHLDLSSIVDGNSDSWYEYEIFEIPEQVRLNTYGYGFSYDEGFKWIKEDREALRLHLEVELPIAKTINWFSLSPFIRADKGTVPAVIKSITIHDGKGKVTEISSTYDVLQEDKVYIFPRQSCKKVVIQIEQNSAYQTNIGHFFFKELEEKSVNYMARNKEQEGRRIEGPRPSVRTLMYQYDAQGRKLIQPERRQGLQISDSSLGKQMLFTAPSVEGQVQSGLEVLPARRFMIGLRDVSISSTRFNTEATYISTPFYASAGAIRKIALRTNATVPKEFGSGEWIRYHISINDGEDWHEIVPRGISKEGGKLIYYINENIPIEGRNDHYGYIDTLDAVKNVRLKITLTRPSDIKDAEYFTPYVSDYQIIVDTVKE